MMNVADRCVERGGVLLVSTTSAAVTCVTRGRDLVKSASRRWLTAVGRDLATGAHSASKPLRDPRQPIASVSRAYSVSGTVALSTVRTNQSVEIDVGVAMNPAVGEFDTPPRPTRELVPVADQRDPGDGLIRDGEQGAGGVLIEHSASSTSSPSPRLSRACSCGPW